MTVEDGQMLDLQTARARLQSAEADLDRARAAVKDARAVVGDVLAGQKGFALGDKVRLRGVDYQLTRFEGKSYFVSFVAIYGVRLKKNGEIGTRPAVSLAFGFDEMEKL